MAEGSATVITDFTGRTAEQISANPIRYHSSWHFFKRAPSWRFEIEDYQIAKREEAKSEQEIENWRFVI
jgi:hypothetical protein